MSFDCFFLGSSWILTLMVIWFNTDAVVHYLQLVGLFEKTRLDYMVFLRENAFSYFPDFLYKVSLRTNNRLGKFLLKLISCPFCIGVWLSLITSVLCAGTWIYAPCFYIVCISTFFCLRKFIF